MIHELKTWPEYYEDLERGVKTFEIRIEDDRKYQVGDILHQKEYDPFRESFTGRSCWFIVPYLLRKQPFVPGGYVCMSIVPIEQPKKGEGVE